MATSLNSPMPHDITAMASAYADSAYPALGISRETVAASPVLRAALALRRKVQAARNKPAN